MGALKTLVHDISYWQGNLSKYWQLFKDKGCKGVICQSTNGMAYQRYFHEAAPQIKVNGFLVGSYHYYRQHIQDSQGNWVVCDPVKQADNYYNWVMKSGVPMDFPPVLDVENGGNPYGISSGSVDKCLRRIEERFGRTPMLYSNPSMLNNITLTGWKKYPLWIAHYTTEDKVSVPREWDKWTIWQFSDKITYKAGNAAKAIDHNWFNGDLMDLYAFCGLGEIEPPEEPEPPIIIPPADYYVRVKATWLRFRREPSLYAGDTLAVGKGVLLKVTGDKVRTDNEYWPVELDGYDGFVSAGSAYTELV